MTYDRGAGVHGAGITIHIAVQHIITRVHALVGLHTVDCSTAIITTIHGLNADHSRERACNGVHIRSPGWTVSDRYYPLSTQECHAGKLPVVTRDAGNL